MSAENMIEQEQLHIKDNETIQLDQDTKLCKVDSLSNISSKSTENIGNCVDSVRISNDAHDNKMPCQSDEQISQNLKKSTTFDIGSINEQISCNDKVDDVFVKKNLITETAIDKDINNSSRPNPVIELSDDYVEQMMKNLNDRNNALYDGVFLEADKKNSVPIQESSVPEELKNTNNNKELDKLELIVNNDDNIAKKSIVIDSLVEKDNEKRFIGEQKIESNSSQENSCLKEKSIEIDFDNEKDNENRFVDENKTGKPNLLASNELLIVDESNNPNTEIGKNSSIKNSYVSKKQINDVTTEPDNLINRLQNMDWLKPAGHEMMDTNRRKMACKSSIEKVEYNEDIKEELAEDAKTKANKKRSNQRKSVKSKAADCTKEDNAEEKNKMSSYNIGPTKTSKIDSSKSANVCAVEKSKGVTTSQRTCIGRGRSDRRRSSHRISQQSGQTDICDQRNKTYKSSEDKSPNMVEKNVSKSETYSNAQGSSTKIENAENFTENLVACANSTKSKEQEINEGKNAATSHKDEELLHKQSPVETAEYIESSTQENKREIDIKKGDQLSSDDNHQESQSKSDDNLSSRPIYGRSVDKSNSEKVVCSVKGFGQNTDEAIKNNNQSSKNVSSKDNYNRFSEQGNRNHHENKSNQSSSSLLKTKEESCSNRYSNSNNSCNQDFPRWNHNNYPDKQNVKRDEILFQKSHTSNRHRNIADENRENEDSFNKNQVFTNSQGNRCSDKFSDSRSSVGRYSGRNQDNKFHDRHYDRNQDDKNYAEQYSNKYHDNKSYHNSDSEKPQTSHRDTYLDNNYRSRGFGERYFAINQDRSYGSSHSNKFQDSKSFSDRYTDNQQSKTSTEKCYNKKRDENETVTKKQESLNKNPVKFDKNENYNDKYHTATNSSDSSSTNQNPSHKYNESSNLAKTTYNRNHGVDEDTNGRNQQTFNNNTNYKNQGTSNNIEPEYNVKPEYNLCPQHQQEQFSKNFWLPPDQIDLDKTGQYKSNHFDNTQQVKTYMGSNKVPDSRSVPSDAYQQELSSAVSQNIESHGRITPLSVRTKTQTSQSESLSTYKNIPKQDAAYSSEFQSGLPYTNVNTAGDPVMNEYNVQYNQTLLDSAYHLNHPLAPGQKTNVVMSFEGNQNVQKVLGMDPRIVGQCQSSQVENNDPSLSNTNSQAPCHPIYTNENVAQFFQSAVANSPAGLTCVHSTMNVNAQPFEVVNQSNQESNNLQTTLNQDQSGITLLDNPCVVGADYMNVISNDSEELLKLLKEVSDLQKQLTIKQAQLLALQVRSLKNAGMKVINQRTNPAIQHMSNNHLVPEPNQTLQPSYVKHSLTSPGFVDPSIDMQNSQMNMFKMLSNVTNVQNQAIDSLPSNTVSEPKSNVQPVYHAQGNMYQQQTATYHMYTDRTTNSAAYINMMPQRAEQRQIKGGNQFHK